MFEKYLQDIGLSDKESQIYIALLSFENASAIEIAKKTGIKRPTVYVVLETLAKKGLASETTVGKKTYYYAESPERLHTFVEKKILSLNESGKILRDVIPQLKSIMREYGEKPIVKYFEGKEGVVSSTQEMLRSLSDNKDSIYSVYSKDAIEEVFSMEELKRLRDKRISKKIKTYTIYSSKKDTRDSDEMSQRLKVDGEKYPITCDITAYEDSTLITVLGKRISSIFIKNKDVAETLKSLIRLVHDYAKK